MHFEVMVDRTPGDRGVFESLASQLGKVGVPTTLRIVTFGSWMVFCVPLMLFNLVLAWLWLQLLFLPRDFWRSWCGRSNKV